MRLIDSIRALNDSGAQLCVVRSDVISPLGLQPVGTAVLSGICRGDVVRADVVSLQLKFVDGQQYVPIDCVVCNQLSDSLILRADIVDKLQRQWLLC